MPESRQHREDRGSNDSEGHKFLGEVNSVFWPIFFGNFRNLGVFCFFFTCFFCSRMFWGCLLGRRKQTLGGMFTLIVLGIGSQATIQVLEA